MHKKIFNSYPNAIYVYTAVLTVLNLNMQVLAHTLILFGICLTMWQDSQVFWEMALEEKYMFGTDGE